VVCNRNVETGLRFAPHITKRRNGDSGTDINIRTKEDARIRGGEGITEHWRISAYTKT
jgi:hypothetical protein